MIFMKNAVPNQLLSFGKIAGIYRKNVSSGNIVVAVMLFIFGGVFSLIALLGLVRIISSGDIAALFGFVPMMAIGAVELFFGVKVLQKRKKVLSSDKTQFRIRECRCTNIRKEWGSDADSYYGQFVDCKGIQFEHLIPEIYAKYIINQDFYLLYVNDDPTPAMMFPKYLWERTEQGFVGRNIKKQA